MTSILFLCIGFTIPLTATILYFHFQDALTYAYESFSYIVLYAKGPAQSSFDYIVIKFIVRSILFALSGLPMWIGAYYVIFRVVRGDCFVPLRSARAPRNDGASPRNYGVVPRFALFLTFWFFFSLFAIIAGGRMYFHYFYVVLPAAAALAGIWWHMRGYKMKKFAKAITLFWIIFCVSGWTFYATYLPLRPLAKKETWLGAATHLKTIAKPDDTLFVWGQAPQIFFYSGIKIGTRFTAADYLTGKSPMTAGLEYNPNMKNPPSTLNKVWHDFVDRPGLVIFDTSQNIYPKGWEYFIKDTEFKLPTYIVDTSPSNYRRYGRYPIANYPYLYNLLKKNYKKIKEIDGHVVYKVR